MLIPNADNALVQHITVFEQAVAQDDAAGALVALRRVCVLARAELGRQLSELELQLSSPMGHELCQAMKRALHAFGERLYLDDQLDEPILNPPCPPCLRGDL
jgi:hypothetical protein